jgi:hypothetical protein
MRKIAITVAAGAMLFGSLATAQVAQAAQTTTHDTIVYTQPAGPPRVEALDCVGTTGAMGCGPGWIWRDGWRGWGCYPC